MFIAVYIIGLFNDLRIANGYQRKVGYHTGMIMVRPSSDPIGSRSFTKELRALRCLYIMLSKPSLCCNGVAPLITSGASPFFCWASCAEASSNFRVLSGRLSSNVDLRPVVLNGRSFAALSFRETTTAA